jgi:polyhydroxyalkanoate synthesis repressor PhaR
VRRTIKPKRAHRGRPPGRERTDPSVTLIKKYGNRRLYDTRRSRYVTLDDMLEVIAAGEEIRVLDAKTGEDLTKRVVTKIIFLEEQKRNLDLLPLDFLRKLVQHRDDSLREFYQRYLALSLEVYQTSQEKMRELAAPAPAAPVADELAALKTRIANLEARVKR